MGTANDAHVAPLLGVGFGKHDITPPTPVRLSGYAARTNPSVGVHDRLWARSLAIRQPDGDTIVLLALDLIGVSATFTGRVREELRIRWQRGYREQGSPSEIHIGVLATHTHGGPASLTEAFLGEVEEAILEIAVAGSVAAACRALDDLGPARLTFSAAAVRGIARNRRVPGGPVDEELAVLAAWRPGASSPAGLLVSFALHPVVLGPDNLQVTRDYPGYLVDELERRYPGSLCVFACGCAGDVNHGHTAAASWTTQPDSARTYTTAEKIGHRLAAAATQALAKAGESERLEPVVSSAGTSVRLPYGPAPDPATQLERFAAVAATAREAGDHATRAFNDDLVAWAEARLNEERSLKLAAERPPTAGLDVEIQSFGIGDLSVLLLPGEPFVKYGLRLKGSGTGRVLPLAYANAAPGYLPTAVAVGDGGYEVETAYMFYGAPAPFAAGVEEAVVGAASRLIGRAIPGGGGIRS